MMLPLLFHQTSPLPQTVAFSHPPIKTPGFLTVHTTVSSFLTLTRVTKAAFQPAVVGLLFWLLVVITPATSVFTLETYGQGN